MAIQIKAAWRLAASKADESQAKALLTSLGFAGLTLNNSGDNQIAFSYSKFDQAALISRLGKPNNAHKMLTWKYKDAGTITVMPKSHTVYLFNKSK